MARSISTDPAEGAFAEAEVLDVGRVYDAQADFAWRSLHRLGVPTRDVPDLLQEVFVVVHRRRADYDPARPIRAWVWGICVGLARNYRRRSSSWRERLLGLLPERIGGAGPEDALERSRQRERGQRALAALDPEKRAVFVMFEVEGMSGREIAELLSIPVGTVHSRLHAARRELWAQVFGGER